MGPGIVTGIIAVFPVISQKDRAGTTVMGCLIIAGTSAGSPAGAVVHGFMATTLCLKIIA
jgi:hypothetical protein